MSSFIAADIEVANSGAEVPAATIVTAITQSEIPTYLATLEACLTIKSPPSIIKKRPIKKRKYDFLVASDGFTSSGGSFFINKRLYSQ